MARLRRGRAFWLGVMTVTLAIVMAAALARRPLDWRRLAPAQLTADDAPAGQLEGRVWKIDPDAGTIHVSSRLFGFGATPLQVTSETLVVVGAKEGGFGDLREGLRVRVAWEKRQARRVARSVEVVERTGAAEPARRPAATAPGDVAPSSPERTPAEPPRAKTSPPALPRAAAPAAAQTPKVAPPAPSTAAQRPVPAQRPAAAQPSAPAQRPAPAPAPAPALQATPPAETAVPPREADAADPTAVIDWLLKEAGRSP